MKYLFVDFDGVLHGEQINRDLFCHSTIFCERLLPYKYLFEIIISSSWRDVYSYDVCQHAFDLSIRDRVVGVTPSFGIDGFETEGRYKEIIAYCEQHCIALDQWIAIDDMAQLFPPKCANLLLTNGKTGITSDILDELEHWIMLP